MTQHRIDELHEIKELLVSASTHLVRENIASDRRAVDDMRLAMLLLVGLVEGHRHTYCGLPAGAQILTGPMQALE